MFKLIYLKISFIRVHLHWQLMWLLWWASFNLFSLWNPIRKGYASRPRQHSSFSKLKDSCIKLWHVWNTRSRSCSFIFVLWTIKTCKWRMQLMTCANSCPDTQLMKLKSRWRMRHAMSSLKNCSSVANVSDHNRPFNFSVLIFNKFSI